MNFDPEEEYQNDLLHERQGSELNEDFDLDEDFAENDERDYFDCESDL